jgi:nitrogen-specific signal transduction histidine kinase/ActR/RegA family two-component response regulator
VLRDVSRELSLQQQLAASQRLESVGRLAGGIAHDFNNLLTVILSGAESLEEDLRLARPASVDDAREVREAGERARELTRQLLALARRQVIAPVPVDVGATLRSCERLLRRVLGGDVAWTVSVQPDLWLLRCDPSQLEQVVLNLAVNARDAMPHGGTLAFEATNLAAVAGAPAGHPGLAAGDFVRVVVRDTGVGMSAAVVERLFEPFFTTKPPGKGTGLGLSTVYGIVRQNGGSIRCESAPGAGASFELLFPRTVEPLRPVEARPQTRAARGSETILLVEDEPAVRELAARALRGAGYRVLVAPDGAEALQLSARETAPVHLLLSDMVLPGLGGRQLAAELRRLRPGLRVLLMSGYVAAADDRDGIAEEGTSFLPKPFSAGALLDKVRQTIDAPPGPPARGAAVPGG